jgi:hypothetical protein
MLNRDEAVAVVTSSKQTQKLGRKLRFGVKI